MYSSFQAALLRLARTLAVLGLDFASRRCGSRRLFGSRTIDLRILRRDPLHQRHPIAA